MKKIIFSLCIFLLVMPRLTGQSVAPELTPLNTLSILMNTPEPQQSKVWTYAGRFWTVLGASSGTNIYRLDGTTWTSVFSLASGNFVKADIKVVGNVTHIMVYKGSSSVLYSVEYDVPTNKYKLWNVRKTRVDFTLESANQTVTIDIDGTGRMWMASDGSKDVNLRWSDAPYSVWSGPVKLDINTSTTDLCAVVALPLSNQIGVFWSNKITKRFGFKTHNDGADPNDWSADEAPGAAGALNIGAGLAENQFNIKVSSNGRVYATVKTAYNTAGNTQVGLLVRQPSGTWDPLQQVTVFSGINPTVIINDSLSVLKVIYKMPSGIVYRQSALNPVAFGAEQPLISGAYDFPSAAKNPYNSQMVVIASTTSVAAGVLIKDTVEVGADVLPPVTQSINRQSPLQQTTSSASLTYRIVFNEPVSGVDITDFQTTVLNGSVNSVAGSVSPVGGTGSTYDVSLNSVSGNGTVRLDLKGTGTGITDASGNAIASGYTTGQTYIITEPAPTLTSVEISSGNTNNTLARPGDIVTLTFTASESVSQPVVTIAGRSASVSASGGNSFNASVTMQSGDPGGIVAFSIDFATTSGTPGVTVTQTTNSSTVTYDKVNPVVSSVNRQTPSQQTTNASTVTFRVVFSEPVSGVDITDFETTVVSGIVNSTPGSVTPTGGTGTTYDVTLNSVSGNGTIRLDLKASGTGITDEAGNTITGGFNSGQTYIITENPPTLTTVSISSDNSASAIARPGDLVTLAFTASGPVTLPVVTIAGRSVTTTALGGNSYSAGTTMLAGDPEGIVSFTIDFSSTSGTAGSTVTQTTNSTTVTFDKTLPAASSINRQIPLQQATTSSSLIFRVIFSEGVNGVNTTDFVVTIVSGSIVSNISAVTPVGGTGSIYDITLNGVTGDGTLRLDLKSSGTDITDEAGNPITGGFNSGQTYIKTTVAPMPGAGFASIVQLTPLGISVDTKDKPQSKVWKYANQWWCVLSVPGSTKIYRLDGITWTPVYTLATTTGKHDVRTDGDLVHILLYKGDDNNSFLYSIEYVPATNSYKAWTQRPDRTIIAFPEGSETATLALDGLGNLWASAAGTTSVYAWVSAPPYTTWSQRITIATGIKDDDICAITALPNENKIGIIWSNQTTKRFGFRTHTDGDLPDTWSALEIPAAASAQDNIGGGMADDHLNMKLSSDGTLYCAVKTSFNKNNYTKIGLLIRRPNGTWDQLHQVTLNPNGTQPVVIVNETKGTLKVIYASGENGGDIFYKESPISTISFGAEKLLLGNDGNLYDYVTTNTDTYSPEVVLIASKLNTSPHQAVGLLASDEELPEAGGLAQSMTGRQIVPVKPTEPVKKEIRPALLTPNPFEHSSTLRFTLAETGDYSIVLYNASGRVVQNIKRGQAQAGVEQTVTINGSGLAGGMYFIRIQTAKTVQTITVLKD
ncbi:MAG: T9SS type A sorting domain-containing protein [Chitinophagaceae bacterium]